MVFELADIEQYPTMNFTVENWTYLDPKGHPICAVKDIFSKRDGIFGDSFVMFDDDEITKEIVLCMPHEPAAVPMQRCDAVGESKWWMYCKKCGTWTHPADVPGNKR
jgi:hypothetical protein